MLKSPLFIILCWYLHLAKSRTERGCFSLLLMLTVLSYLNKQAQSRKNKIPMAKRSIVCSYTKEGRALIHTELNLNQYVLKGLREKISVGHSTEYHDSKISLFSAQKGKCAISGEEFADAEHVAVWLKVPGSLGGFERYKNMVLIHKKYLILLQELPQAAIKDLIKTLNITKKMLVKINSLREQANLSAII